QPYACALDAIDDPARFRRERATDEAFRIAPQVAVIDARLRAELGPHHFKALLARHALHRGVLDRERAHRACRARLVTARLLPALIDEMGVERPVLRDLEFLIPPDVAVRAGVNEVLAPLCLLGIDQHDAVLAFADRTARFGDAGGVIAVVAH